MSAVHSAASRAALISIRPEHAAKILSGEKCLEFRRRWAIEPVVRLVIYASRPQQQIVALADIAQVHRGDRASLWALARQKKGGIGLEELYAYLDGCANGYALELCNVQVAVGGIDPYAMFGITFHPPQSFRYLNAHALQRLEQAVRARQRTAKGRKA